MTAAGTFNISTIAALVVAGAGVPVAKHGNRAASSHCGSADLLEELGVKIDLDAAGRRAMPRRSGHRVHVRAGPSIPRWPTPDRSARELKVPTVFNFLGPLTNPARPYAQVVGVSDERMLPLMAEVLARRGTRAMLFRGVDGLDELTTTDLSTVYDVKDGNVRETHLDPAKVGIGRVKPDDLAGGDAPHNADIARRVIDGETGPQRDVVVLNAGAALQVAGFAGNLEEGMATAARAIDDGDAAEDARPDGSRSPTLGSICRR